MLGPGGAPHAPMLEKGKQALEEEVEGEEGTIEAKGEVVLLSVDELVAFITNKHSMIKKCMTISCCDFHVHDSLRLYN